MRPIFLFALANLVLFWAFPALPLSWLSGQNLKDANYQIKTIVIDAGHGGRDRGCSGRYSREKDINLSICKQLGQRISATYPNLRVVYTRQKDLFVPLHRRAAIANRNKADLFISIHCNAIPNARYVRGSETYVMGLHTADENLDVVKRENDAILLEEDYRKNYEGLDPDSPEGHIILSSYQNAYLEQSILLAEKIEHEFRQKTQRRSYGVKQAGFLVLRQTAMPSVLVELGYLTNAKDEAFLRSQAGQTTVVQSLFAAFQSYKRDMEASRPTASLSKVSEDSRKLSSSIRSRQSAGNQAPGSNFQYKVQLASSIRPLNISTGRWLKVSYALEEDREGSRFRYYATGFTNKAEAEEARLKLLQQGFKGAFVIGFENGKRILLSE